MVTDQNENQLPQIEGAAVIEVGEVPGEGSYVLEIPNQQESAMLFQIADGGALLPVKSCVWKNGSLYAKLTQNGYYAIKNMPANFTDVSGWGAFYVESLYQRGIISGRSEKIFAPNDAVLREEFVKLIVELFGGAQSGDAASFSDVSEDDWFYPYVATAYQKGYISGIDESTFGVGMQITRQDMCKIIENVLQKNGVAPALEAAKFSDDEAIAGYAKNAVDLLFELDIVSGDDQGAFHPQNSATRQEAAKIIFGVLSFQIFNL